MSNITFDMKCIRADPQAGICETGLSSSQITAPLVQQALITNGAFDPMVGVDTPLVGMMLTALRDGPHLMTFNAFVEWPVAPAPALETYIRYSFRVNGINVWLPAVRLAHINFKNPTETCLVAMTWTQTLTSGDIVEVFFTWTGSTTPNVQTGAEVFNLIAL